MERMTWIDGSDPPLRIRAGGRTYRFEMHHFFGPVMLDESYEPVADVPGPDDPFWRALDLWQERGRRLDPDRICIWED